MRILFFVDDFKGGAGNVIQLLAMEFKNRKHTVAVVCLGGNTPGRYDLSDIPVYRIRTKGNRLLTYWGFVKGGRRIINQFFPDCVVSFLFGVSSFVNLSMFGMRVPLIVSERSDPNYLKPNGIIKILTEFAYKRSKAIVVLFDSFKTLSGGKYIEKAITIPNPVPIINLPLRVLDQNEIRFVTIANNTPPKGLDILVRAFVKAKKETSNIKLRIYGSDKNGELNTIVQSCNAASFISLMGYTLNINAALEWADVYVMPSRHEGFPNSLCEAMSAGKCCVATECHSGISDLIKNGINGIIVPPECIDDLSSAIVNLAKNSAMINEIGDNATSISQRYSLETVFNQWEQLIKRVV